MPTRLYRFHCIGPADAVLDLRGGRVATLALVRARADRVAVAMMERGAADWAGWIVDVRDDEGRSVLVRPFADIRGRRNPARTRS